MEWGQSWCMDNLLSTEERGRCGIGREVNRLYARVLVVVGSKKTLKISKLEMCDRWDNVIKWLML